MIPNRISDEAVALMEGAATPMETGFMMMPAPAAAAQPMSPLQILYQHVYEQAVAEAQKPGLRDLFVVMN